MCIVYIYICLIWKMYYIFYVLTRTARLLPAQCDTRNGRNDVINAFLEAGGFSFPTDCP